MAAKLPTLGLTTAKNNPTIRGPLYFQLFNQVAHNSKKAFDTYRKTPNENVGKLLNTIANNLERDRQIITEMANKETNLPLQRCENELTRTVNQLRMFGKVATEGVWVDARINKNIRSMLVPLGPVTVFGASNFPLAFSTCGGDTASALAAKCTVVYKVHPGHPQTTDLCYKAVVQALEENKLPQNIFQLAPQEKNQILVGKTAVFHPFIKAVGFTGSRKAGLALQKVCRERVEPIPFYGELSSINPMFILPDALENQLDSIAKGLVGSFTLGVGQFCTKPGLVFIQGKKEVKEKFLNAVAEETKNVPAAQMLTEDIYLAYRNGYQETLKSDAKLLIKNEDEGNLKAGASVFRISGKKYMEAYHFYQMELFGPCTIIVDCEDTNEMLKISKYLEGQLTGTFHAEESDLTSEENLNLIQSVSKRVGRIIMGGYPTGVEVNDAMQHGGPYPSSTEPRTTSVGTRAILRWARPLCFQNFPENLLPDELKDSNPLKIKRLEE